ncbi:hypothetical protein [Streptomyces sp. OE57]|uniref:hypothetical protein n=1 Tax=Streptomyces lacaronensis TaxID=3379885 RepID=UPI0039B76F94
MACTTARTTARAVLATSAASSRSAPSSVPGGPVVQIAGAQHAEQGGQGGAVGVDELGDGRGPRRGRGPRLDQHPGHRLHRHPVPVRGHQVPQGAGGRQCLARDGDLLGPYEDEQRAPRGGIAVHGQHGHLGSGHPRPALPGSLGARHRGDGGHLGAGDGGSGVAGRVAVGPSRGPGCSSGQVELAGGTAGAGHVPAEDGVVATKAPRQG